MVHTITKMEMENWKSTNRLRNQVLFFLLNKLPFRIERILNEASETAE